MTSLQTISSGWGSRGASTNLFSVVTINRTQGNAMKLCQGGLDWISGKKFLTEWLGTGTEIPRKVFTAPSLAEFQKCLGNCLRSMV